MIDPGLNSTRISYHKKAWSMVILKKSCFSKTQCKPVAGGQLGWEGGTGQAGYQADFAPWAIGTLVRRWSNQLSYFFFNFDSLRHSQLCLDGFSWVEPLLSKA